MQVSTVIYFRITEKKKIAFDKNWFLIKKNHIFSGSFYIFYEKY